MNKYVFSVPKYKAINYASIVNDGITVISGENGSGKSTLSRMMYYMVNIMNDFAEVVFRDSLSTVMDVARPLYDVLKQISFSVQNVANVRTRFEQLPKSGSFDDLDDNFKSMIQEYESLLITFFSKENDSKKRLRILDFLGVEATGTPDEIASACVDVVINKYDAIIKKAIENIDRHPRQLLIDYIRFHGLDLDDFPSTGIKFTEGGVDLLYTNTFSTPLSLHRAIYIDTPMAVNDNFNFSTRYWNNLNVLLNKESVKGTLDEIVLKKKLQRILHGDILIEKDPFSQKTKLCYQRQDGLEIDLVNAATGFKSFAYLLRLLANGYLKDDTLLLIDEPEAHLHPQWIVEFANILVQLNKVLGVRIIVTSHNPDMVSAIRTITESEGILENTRFYLAKCLEQESFRYDYIDLGTNIGPIFESFNIALNRIEFYGAGNI